MCLMYYLEFNKTLVYLKKHPNYENIINKVQYIQNKYYKQSAIL